MGGLVRLCTHSEIMLFCYLRLIFKPYCSGISSRKTENQSASGINLNVHILRKRRCYKPQPNKCFKNLCSSLFLWNKNV